MTELITSRSVSGRQDGILDGDGMDGHSGGGGDVFRRNAAIDEVAIANVEVVDHRGLIEKLRYLGRSCAKTTGMRIAKILGWDKRETARAQT